MKGTMAICKTAMIALSHLKLKYLKTTQTKVIVKIVWLENMRSPHPLVASTRNRISLREVGGAHPLQTVGRGNSVVRYEVTKVVYLCSSTEIYFTHCKPQTHTGFPSSGAGIPTISSRVKPSGSE
mmetsp:Transcript_5425/g.11198  ORF Transcript_5425/g.11198 Transcript_5425/m.11198 type:complete len:125 (+) Transcript_5425:104-478(+)